MKTKKTIQLSAKSLSQAKEFLNDFLQAYQKGVQNSVKKATEYAFEKVKQYCYDNGISEHTGNVKFEYDEINNVGRVYTNDAVLIFNEMGTGIVGSENPHPNPSKNFKDWKYDKKEHGEKGWKYPKGDGTYGWTKGLPSRHMFYDAFEDIIDEIGNIVDVELEKTVGDLYDSR